MLRYKKRDDIYSNSTGSLTYDPSTKTAYSYGWYEIARKIEDMWVLNDYNYSNTTAKHKNEIKRFLMQELNACNVLCIEAPRGLQDLQRAKEYYEDRIDTINKRIMKVGSHRTTNNKRKHTISSLQKVIETIDILIVKDSYHQYAKEFDEKMEELLDEF